MVNSHSYVWPTATMFSIRGLNQSSCGALFQLFNACCSCPVCLPVRVTSSTHLLPPQSRDAGGSDSEREDAELADIKKVLEKHDPGYMRAQALPTQGTAAGVASLYQVALGVERFR